MDSRTILEQEITDLRKQIKIRQDALHALTIGQSKAGTPNLRFYSARPIDAIRTVLSEHGGRWTREEVEKELEEGGIAHGRKRGKANVRISIDKNVAIGNLVEDGLNLVLPQKS